MKHFPQWFDPKQVQIGSDENYESINIRPAHFPMMREKIIQEHMTQNNFDSREEAEEFVDNTEIELELIYHPEYGLIAVDAGATEANCDIVSPYTGEVIPYGNPE